MGVRRTVGHVIGRALVRLWAAAGTVAATVLRTVLHPSGGSRGWSLLNRTQINYAAEVTPSANSIIEACIGWAQRNFSEAPPILERWNPDREDWDQHRRDELLDLLERPNPYYSGGTLARAAVADYVLTGDGYILKVRSATGRDVELWWAPKSMMTAMADPRDPSVFISHYEYRPGAGAPSLLRVEDVIHMQDGCDPANPREGWSQIKCLFREIFTDDEAANMTAALLRNAGVPGVIISPEHGTIPPAAAEEVKTTYMQKFGGDRRGEPMVTGGAVKITQFGFSPEQMQMRALRGIPEERITAVIGINSAVLGLGAGLATTKVGATLREYREEATESFMVPLWHAFAQALTHQLVPDFKGAGWRLVFDLSRVRVLQDDENRRAEHLGKRLAAGGITVAEYRRALGMVAKPEHEVYLRARSIVPVPAGLTPEQQAEAANSGGGTGAPAEQMDAEAVVAAVLASIKDRP